MESLSRDEVMNPRVVSEMPIGSATDDVMGELIDVSAEEINTLRQQCIS